MKKDLNKTIETLFNKTIDVVKNGKEEINSLVSELKEEYAKKLIELSDIQGKLIMTIDEVDALSIEEKRSRKRLAEVSTDFVKFNESDIKNAYEYTHTLRAKLEIKRQEERLYLNRRKELELCLKRMITNINKGEKTVDKFIKIAEYIEGNKKEINESLEDINKIQLFGIKVIEAQEEERKRIARDIHDGPAQDLANIMLRAEYCEKIIDKDFLRAREEIKALKSDVNKTLNNIRKIIYDLRPMSLDDLGLIPTIQKYIKEYEAETRLNVEFTFSPDFSGINPVIETAIYRVVQEAFNNIKKHANAKNIYFTLKLEKDREKYIFLKIEDDGIGFSESMYRQKLENKYCGFGIVGMKERIEILKGKFKIDSKENMGTIIKIVIPIVEEGRLD